jgi:predicted amidohydrolase
MNYLAEREMTNIFTVACVQNTAGPAMETNLVEVAELVRHAKTKGAELVCLPEFFSCLEVKGDEFELGAMDEQDHPAIPLFSNLAQELGLWILMGSLAVKAGPGKIRNRSYLLDATGRIVARYDKVHLFDVDLGDGESYRESATVEPGGKAVLAPTPWGTLGMSVCYDLRFPHLYRALAQTGAGFLAVPAAFTKTTGQDHWHVLLRARAIETGSYVFAPCQCGYHGESESYGHSLIIDPWGEILAEGGEEPGLIVAEVDPARVQEARRKIPSLTHDRPFEGPTPSVVEGGAAQASLVP